MTSTMHVEITRLRNKEKENDCMLLILFHHILQYQDSSILFIWYLIKYSNLLKQWTMLLGVTIFYFWMQTWTSWLILSRNLSISVLTSLKLYRDYRAH